MQRRLTERAIRELQDQEDLRCLNAIAERLYPNSPELQLKARIDNLFSFYGGRILHSAKARAQLNARVAKRIAQLEYECDCLSRGLFTNFHAITGVVQ